MKLYCFGHSGHSYKAALTLELAGQTWQPVFVDFFKGEARSERFKAEINAMGECPVLIDGDVHLSQSGVILEYLAEKTGFFCPSEADRYEVRRWLYWDNHKFSGQIGMTRFLNNFLPPEKRNADVIAFQIGRGKAAFKVLEDHLEGRDWIVGSGPSLADLACCSYLYYPEDYGWDKTKTPNISRWLEGISSLPGWQHPYDLMPSDQALINATPAASAWHKP